MTSEKTASLGGCPGVFLGIEVAAGGLAPQFLTLLPLETNLRKLLNLRLSCTGFAVLNRASERDRRPLSIRA